LPLDSDAEIFLQFRNYFATSETHQHRPDVTAMLANMTFYWGREDFGCKKLHHHWRDKLTTRL